MTALSNSSLRVAFRSHSDEYAWRPLEALTAVSELEAAAEVILGGEVWLVQDGSICAMVPTPDGPPAVIHWEVSARTSGESWHAFVTRAAAHARAAISDIAANGVSSCVPSELVYVNLTWDSEAEYSAGTSGS